MKDPDAVPRQGPRISTPSAGTCPAFRLRARARGAGERGSRGSGRRPSSGRALRCPGRPGRMRTILMAPAPRLLFVRLFGGDTVRWWPVALESPGPAGCCAPLPRRPRGGPARTASGIPPVTLLISLTMREILSTRNKSVYCAQWRFQPSIGDAGPVFRRGGGADGPGAGARKEGGRPGDAGSVEPTHRRTVPGPVGPRGRTHPRIPAPDRVGGVPISGCFTARGHPEYLMPQLQKWSDGAVGVSRPGKRAESCCCAGPPVPC